MADIALLAYEATIWDVRAQVEVAYYQLALDTALGGATGAQLISLGQVLRATQIAYAANQATQADFMQLN